MVRRIREPRQSVVSLKVTDELRRLLEVLAAQMTIKTGQRWTLTDVLEEAIKRLAEEKGVM